MPSLNAVQRPAASVPWMPQDIKKPAVPNGSDILRTSQSQGTIVTLRLHPPHRQPELKTLSQLRGYRVLLGAAHVPQSHMVRAQTDRYLCLELQAEVAVLALEEQQAGWRVSVEMRRVAGTAEAVWPGEEETWAKAEF